MLSETRRERNAEGIGNRLKKARMDHGLTGKELADKIGLSHYTMISQFENGHTTLPPAFWLRIAEALEFDKTEFVVSCLSTLQGEIYEAVFGDLARHEVVSLLKNYRELRKGLPKPVLADGRGGGS